MQKIVIILLMSMWAGVCTGTRSQSRGSGSQPAASSAQQQEAAGASVYQMLLERLTVGPTQPGADKMVYAALARRVYGEPTPKTAGDYARKIAEGECGNFENNSVLQAELLKIVTDFFEGKTSEEAVQNHNWPNIYIILKLMLEKEYTFMEPLRGKISEALKTEKQERLHEYLAHDAMLKKVNCTDSSADTPRGRFAAALEELVEKLKQQ